MVDFLLAGAYPLNVALGDYRALVQAEFPHDEHPKTTPYQLAVTSRTDFTPPAATDQAALLGPRGSYLVLAAAQPVAGVRQNGPICISIQGQMRNVGSGVYIVDQRDVARDIVPIYGPPLPGNGPRPVVGYQPAPGVRILGAALGGGFKATTTGTADHTTESLYGESGTLNGKKFTIVLDDLNPAKPKKPVKVSVGPVANAAELTTTINGQIGLAFNVPTPPPVASIDRWNHLVLTSDKRITLVAENPDALAVLGLTAGTYNPLQTREKAYLFLRWDAAARRWNRLAHGGYMAI